MIETQYLQQDQPNTLFISQAISEVIGNQSGEIFQDFSSDFDSELFQQIWKNIHERFGELGCSGTAYRVGQAMFKYGLQEFDLITGAEAIEFRLSPTRTKLWKSLNAACEMIDTYLNKHTIIKDQEDHFKLEISGLGYSMDSSVRNAMDQIFRGMAQAALDWASGGKYYAVTVVPGEFSSTCTLKIDSSPI